MERDRFLERMAFCLRSYLFRWREELCTYFSFLWRIYLNNRENWSVDLLNSAIFHPTVQVWLIQSKTFQYLHDFNI